MIFKWCKLAIRPCATRIPFWFKVHAAKEELRRRSQEACAEAAPVRSLSLLSLLEGSALSPLFNLIGKNWFPATAREIMCRAVFDQGVCISCITYLIWYRHINQHRFKDWQVTSLIFDYSLQSAIPPEEAITSSPAFSIELFWQLFWSPKTFPSKYLNVVTAIHVRIYSMSVSGYPYLVVWHSGLEFVQVDQVLFFLL